MFKKAKKSNIDELINAVIALYLRLLQIDSQDIGKREVNILYNIIKSAFKEKEIPPIQQIQKLIENPYSLEQGVKSIKEIIFASEDGYFTKEDVKQLHDLAAGIYTAFSK